MLDRLLTQLGVFVTSRRVPVIVALLIFTVFCAVNVPSLETDPSPENLIISFGGYEERVADFRNNFGDTDSVVVLLVQARDATAVEPLRYVHTLSRHFQGADYATRVDSLTVTPFPSAGADDEGGGLDTLEEGGGLDALEDEFDEDPAEDPYEIAVEDLVAMAPEHFPMGMLTVAERVGDGSQDVRPAVRGDTVTEAEAASIRAAIGDAPLIVGRLVSGDRQIAAVVLTLDPALGTGHDRHEALRLIDAFLADNPPPDGVLLHTAGLPHLRAAISDRMNADQMVLIPMTLLVCVILLYASFRWVPGMMLPLVTVGLVVMQVIGLMALFREPMTILMNVLPTLLIIIGLADSVHLIGRYSEELRRRSSGDRVVAAREALRHMTIACFLTSFTTAAGLGSLMVSQTAMLRRFGLVAAIGVLIAYVVTILFVPAAITFFGAPIHRKPTSGAASEMLGRGRLEKLMVLGTVAALRRPWWIIAAAAMVVAPSIYAMTLVRVDTALSDTFDVDDPIVTTMHLIDEHLDGVRPLEIVLDANEEGRMTEPDVVAALDRMEAWLDEQPGVLRTTSPADYYHETWRRLAGLPADDRTPFRSAEQIAALSVLLGRIEPSPLDSYVTPDGRHARLEVRMGDVGAQATIRLIRRAQDRLAMELEGVEGVRVSLLGEAYIGSHGVDSVVRDTVGSLGISMLVIFSTLTLLFRSVRLGLLSIPPNILPLAGTFGWMVARGIALDASTAIVFSVAIGVSVDSTIHAFARLVEEEGRGLRRRAAILRAARGTGRAIVVSTVTLVLGFCVLLFSGFVPVRHFGELIAAALTMSLFSTLVFQPALLKVFGGKQLAPRLIARRERKARERAATSLEGDAPKGAGLDAERESAAKPPT